MDSASPDDRARHEGDSCLAPDPKDDTLKLATVPRATVVSRRNGATAWVASSGRHKDGDEEEEEEDEEAPVPKLRRSDSNHFAKEKPAFSSSVARAGVCVPLDLRGGDKVPYTINRYLREYQRGGIRFMYNNYTRSRGCVLGDDMGLGKTVQVIGFLAAVLRKTGTWEDVESNKPQFLQSQIPSERRKPSKVFLIVAPLSVLYNWKEELDTWGHFRCVVVHGLRKEEELARIKKGRTEVALTTYETLRLCLEQFNNIDWSAVFVDEAHKIKNPNSQITQAMKDLKCQIRIGLTGTILQNNLEELWCVMDWAVPGCLGSLGHFKNTFSDPIEQGQRHSATKRALATGRKTVRALVRKISQWFLRRTKALIKEQLPKKDDRVVYCALTDFQQTVYQTVLDTEDVTLLLRSSEKCDCQSGRTRRRCCYKTNSEGAQMKELYFSYLAILRKVANHVALLQSTAGTSKKQEKYVSAICQKVFQKFPGFVQRCKDEAFEALSDPTYSGKMKVLRKLLRHYLQKGDKVLLFSLSTKLLDVLEGYCMAEGLDYSRLDGTTKSKERVQLVKEFNRSTHVNVCLVSTMAGGLGLNFVGANVVVLFDPTWNPANDLQAIDRAYRIGQCRDVTVLRLISLGTVEEVIYLRQVYKQQLQSSVMGKESARRYFEAVQGHDVHKGELFGIKNLFRLQNQGTCLTHKILEREGQVEAGVMTASTHTGEEKEEKEEEEETNRAGEREDSPPANAPAPNDEPAKVSMKDASKISRSLRDFSSGSEEDEEELGVKSKASGPGAVDGRMSLLQHGFSRLLQGVHAKSALGEGDSSSGAEESTSARDPKDQGKSRKKDSAFSGVSKSPDRGMNAAPILGTRMEENGDDGRQERVCFLTERDDVVRKEVVQKAWIDVESDGTSSPDRRKPSKPKNVVPKVYEGYSDESEDLDMEAATRSEKDALRVKGRGRLGSRKRRSGNVRSKYSEEIETFTSSEDEHTPVKKGRSSESHSRIPKTDRPKSELPKDGTRGAAAAERRSTEKASSSSSSNLKGHTSPACRRKDVTIDSVLGGVAEVVYTHSNQRVVGGSRAEELISRAAVRDVFERKMHSQLPANHLLTQLESAPLSPPESQPGPAEVRQEQPSVDHPVTFSKKSEHSTRTTTVIIGETPQAIRRQQLEEMASKFKFPSAREFAAEVLRSSSAQRLDWLRQYYVTLNHPELAKTVTEHFPQPGFARMSSSSTAASSPSTVAARESPAKKTRTLQEYASKPRRRKYNQRNPEPQTKPGTAQNNASVPQEKQKHPKNDESDWLEMLTNQEKIVVDPPNDVPDSEGQEKTVSSARRQKMTKKGSVSRSGTTRAGGGLGGLGPSKAAVVPIHKDTDAPSHPDLSRSCSTTPSKPTAQVSQSSRTSAAFQEQEGVSHNFSPSEQTPSTSNRLSVFTDLLGDTSILDDLLKPKSRGARQSGSPRTPPASSSASTSSCLSQRSPSGITVSANSTALSDSPAPHSPHASSAQRAASKGSRKDFWDILNEGNEESINRLTDLAEVQRVCVNTNFAARSRPAEEESKSLWKTNENFLWKRL